MNIYSNRKLELGDTFYTQTTSGKCFKNMITAIKSVKEMNPETSKTHQTFSIKIAYSSDGIIWDGLTPDTATIKNINSFLLDTEEKLISEEEFLLSKID